MKTYLLCAVVWSITLFFNACRSRQQANTQDTADHSTAVETVTALPTNVAITGRLIELGLTPTSDWRGISLGDEFGKVKVTEKGESFEIDAEHVGYTIELKNLETADVLYYQTAKKVSAIDVDLFLNSRQSANDFQKELESYFTARYGNPKTSDSGSVWMGDKGISVTLNDVSKGKDFGLKIKMGSSAVAM